MTTPSSEPPDADQDRPATSDHLQGWGEAAHQIPDSDLRVSLDVGAEDALRLSLLDLRPGIRILDIGCGDGTWPTLLALHGAEVWSIDVSPDACETTRRRAAVNGVSERVHVRVVTGPDLPFKGAAFDAVHGVDVVYRMDKERFGRELARLLRPAGRAVFSEVLDVDRVTPPDADPPGDTARAVSRDQLDALAEVFNGLVVHDLPTEADAGRFRMPSWINRLMEHFDRRHRPPARHVIELVAIGADAA